jgi:transcriptional regulator with XRE-family HTH domain
MTHFEPNHNRPKIVSRCQPREIEALATRRGVTTDQGMQAIAERIIALRKDAGLTQKQLAEELGVTQPVISGIERGELRVHGELIVELSRLLKVSADEILGIKTPKKKTDKMTPEQTRLWKKFQQIASWPDKDQRAVIRIINTMDKSAAS